MKRFLALILALVLAFCLVACGSGGGNPSGTTTMPPKDSDKTSPPVDSTTAPVQIKKGGTLELSGSLPADKSWFNIRNQTQLAWFGFCIETLMRFTSTGAPECLLAESMTPHKDQLKWTIKLHDGVKFTDGSACDAEAVAWNIQFYAEKGCLASSYYANYDRCEVVDPLTVDVYFTSWEILYDYYLSRTTPIVSKNAYDTKGEEWLCSNPVGTGPFIIDSYQQDISAHLVKNPNYWKGEVYLDAINFTTYTETIVLVQAFKDKKVDCVSISAFNYFEEIAKDVPTANAITCELPDSAGCLNFLTNDPNDPCYDVRVRKAIAYAINTEEMRQTLTRGFSLASTQWCSQDNALYNDKITACPYNVEKAKSLLAEAGYPNGFKTDIYVHVAEAFTNMALCVQEYLSKVGIEVEVHSIEQASYATYIGGWPNGMFIHSMGTQCGAATQYATTFIQGITAGLGVNAFYISDELSALTNSAKTAATAEESIELFKQVAYQVFEEQMIVKNLYLTINCVFEQSYVKDSLYGHVQTTRMDLYQAWLDK